MYDKFHDVELAVVTGILLLLMQVLGESMFNDCAMSINICKQENMSRQFACGT